MGEKWKNVKEPAFLFLIKFTLYACCINVIEFNTLTAITVRFRHLFRTAITVRLRHLFYTI